MQNESIVEIPGSENSPNSAEKAVNAGTTNSAEEYLSSIGWEEYIIDIESKTKLKLTELQKNNLDDALKNKKYKKLTSVQTTKRRIEFDKVRDDVIKDWEKNTGQQWPIYAKDVISEKTGKVLRKAGSTYDAHHIIENTYGGEHEWWNIHPAKFPNEHQGGIHASGSPASKLFKGGK